MKNNLFDVTTKILLVSISLFYLWSIQMLVKSSGLPQLLLQRMQAFLPQICLLSLFSAIILELLTSAKQ